jgi:hypothetical protein
MNRSLSTTITGWFFVLAAVMHWLGWVLLPVKLGAYFDVGDFAAINVHWHLWVWMFRVHIFGFLIAVMALVAIAALLSDSEICVLVWPGAAVGAGGLFVSALAAAFYYHHGAWGALEMTDQAAGAVQRHVDALRLDTEYITCLVRFGRVFFGLGQAVLSAGLIVGKMLPKPIGIAGAILGLVAIVLTMALPDDLVFYRPVFHLNCLWLLAIGVTVLRNQEVTFPSTATTNPSE